MPTKTIYVATGDLPLFDRATRLGGGLSPAITAALRRYVAEADHEPRPDQEKTPMSTDPTPDASTGARPGSGGTDLVELDVTEGMRTTRTRFRGHRVARVSQRQGTREITYQAFVTAKGAYALHVVDRPDWGRWAHDPTMWEDERAGDPDFLATTDRSLTVHDTVEGLLSTLPDDVADEVRTAMTEPAVRELDI